MTLFNDAGAEFSKCRNYRYVLWRRWNTELPMLSIIGLNPSTANEISDDPTIKRVCAIAKNNGFGGIYMLNLFAWVTAYPDELLKCPDPVADNDRWLRKVADLSAEVVFAWGNFKEAQDRAKQVTSMFQNAKALHINKNGSPKHPLYCRADSKLIKFNTP